MPFHDREEELAFLRGHSERPGAGLVVLYGRRRVGKTELLREFAHDRRAVFYVAEMGSAADQRASFSARVFETLGEASLSGTTFPSWEAALRFLADRAAKDRLLVVLDEFPYLVDSDRTLPSILQRAWDGALKRSRIFLVLCGSSVGVMEREILGARNPLYGRRTGQWRLDPMGPREAGLFFRGSPPDGRIEAWAVAGGVPAYLEALAGGKTLRENVLRAVLSRGAPLFDEVRFLLLQELRDPRTYFSLLRAMAAGNTRPNEIAQAAGLADRGVASRYLETLRDLQLVERVYPVTEMRPEKSRKGRYRIADSFVRFWFRFVMPNRSALEAGEAESVYDRKIAPAFEDFVAPAFEEAARRFVRRPPRPSPPLFPSPTTASARGGTGRRRWTSPRWARRGRSSSGSANGPAERSARTYWKGFGRRRRGFSRPSGSRDPPGCGSPSSPAPDSPPPPGERGRAKTCTSSSPRPSSGEAERSGARCSATP